MKYIKSNIFIILVINILSCTSSLPSMTPIAKKCKIITINNQLDNPQSSLQISYMHIEKCPHSKKYKHIGINTILNAPATIKCIIPTEKEYIVNEENEIIKKIKCFSEIRLLDPASKEKKIKLKITSNKNPIIIHPLDEKTKKVRITKGNKELAALTYS